MQKDNNVVFHTVITSERHRLFGFCEPSDFGSLKLFSINPNEKELIVAFTDYKTEKEYVSFQGKAYKKIVECEGLYFFSKEKEAAWQKKQGRFTLKLAMELVLEIRKRMESNYSYVDNNSFLLIGKTLYYEYSKLKDLTITVCGNLSFSCWLSINFEAHGGKKQYKLSKASFEKVFQAEKKNFEAARPAKGTKRGDGHVGFGYPKKITWGEKYK